MRGRCRTELSGSKGAHLIGVRSCRSCNRSYFISKASLLISVHHHRKVSNKSHRRSMPFFVARCCHPPETSRRAIDICQEIDCPNRAAEASLALYQELGKQLAIKGAITTSGRPLDEEVFLLEHELIKQALEDAQGRVTFAACTLGMSYQRLTHKLKTEHKDLLKERTPVRRRPRRQ